MQADPSSSLTPLRWLLHNLGKPISGNLGHLTEFFHRALREDATAVRHVLCGCRHDHSSMGEGLCPTVSRLQYMASVPKFQERPLVDHGSPVTWLSKEAPKGLHVDANAGLEYTRFNSLTC